MRADDTLVASESGDEDTYRVRRGHRGILAFFIVAVTVAGCMFTFKLFSFLKTIKRDELAGFAFDPIVIYGFVATGFLCLLAWAFLTGQFRDVERPKHTMISQFKERERAENKMRESMR